MTTPSVMEPIRTMPDTVPDDNRTIGWDVLKWCTENLLQPDGPNAGQPWQFTDEQVRIVLRWYAITDSGTFAYRQGTVRRLKGWGAETWQRPFPSGTCRV